MHTRGSGRSKLVKACDKTTNDREIAVNQENEIQRQIQSLESGDSGEKLKAITALRQYRTDARVINAFISTLGDGEQIMRKGAAWALGAPEVASRDVVRALAKLLEDPEPDVRAAAAEALGRIGPDAKDAVPMLSRTLKQEGDISVLHHVVVALGCIGSGAKAAVPVLRKARENKRVTRQCERALYRIKHGSG